MEVELQAGERLDDLMTHELKIIQSREVFSFSLDAVLLARFCSVPAKGRVVDLCSGNGVIPILLSTRTKLPVTGVEIQPRLADMARRSVALNRLGGQIDIVEGDLNHYADGEQVTLVTVNPPYMSAQQAADRNDNPHYALARHEIACTLEDVVRAGGRLLQTGGKFAMVHRPTRLVDIVDAMRRHRLEPKRIRFVHPKPGEEPNMVLVEGVKDGKPEMRVLPPMFVHEPDGAYVEEIRQIFYGGDEA
jgi:tRNA1(Val) A37 N6-methylase TrmN6